MNIKFSDKVYGIKPNIFARLNAVKYSLEDKGIKTYNLSVGQPDFPTPVHIREAISKAAMDPKNYSYPLRDLPEMKEAVKNWYKRRYNVDLKLTEIMSVLGTQEGISKISQLLLNPGEGMLIPNPFYTVFEAGPILAGGQAISYPLLRKNNYLPDFDAIPEEDARAAKCIIVSFPSNPVGKAAPDEMYYRLIEFAKKYNLIVIHDNAYSEIIYDGKRGRSFLEFDGAKEIGVEFNSLSKTYNMTGCRIGFCVGNEEIVQKLFLLRMQLDYCDFFPVQHGAIAALNGPQDEIIAQREKYQKRRDVICKGLRGIGFDMPDSEATMFGWAPIPEGYADSEEFCLDALNRTGVILTPGSSFGEYGEGHFRVAFTQPAHVMEDIISILDKSGIARGK